MRSFSRRGTVASLIGLCLYTASASAATDTELRAAFCIGVFDQAIQFYAKAMPPMYITPDGKGFTPPSITKTQKADAAKAIEDLSYKRERLRRFILPTLLEKTDNIFSLANILPLAMAQKEGIEVMQRCATPASCERVRQCSSLNWLPY
jgi:hypothetical protein